MQQQANEIAARLQDYLPVLGGRSYNYGSASQAIKDVLVWLKQWDPCRQPNIIMPTYESSSLYKTALASGYEPRFYEIHDDCRFDVDEISRLVDDNTRAILAIHYFGQPADIFPLRELATRTGKYLIEDCALALVGSINDTPLGAIGDCSIFSARKMMALPDGGILVVRSGADSFRPGYKRRASSLNSLLHLILSRLKSTYLAVSGAVDPLRILKLPESGHINPEEKQEVNVEQMSRVSEFFLNHVNLRRQVMKRRSNYKTLSEGISGFAMAAPLTNDSVERWTPYTFPLRVHHNYRDSLRLRLLESGIACGCGWPEGPFDPKHLRSRALANEILELPVHALLTRRQLRSIIDAIRDFHSVLASESDMKDETKSILQDKATNFII